MDTLSSKYVRSSRYLLGLTQDQLAKKLKIKQYNLSKYETGAAMPSGDFILRIKNLLKKKGFRF